MRAKREKKRKEEEKPTVVADDEAPIVQESKVLGRLTREQFLEWQLTNLKMQMVNKDMENVQLQIHNYETAIVLAKLKRSDLKNSMTRLKEKQLIFMEKVKKESGFDLKGKVINPDTLEVLE